MSAHAGGMCMSQCGHWRIRLFLFASHASEKECKRIPYGVPKIPVPNRGSGFLIIREIIEPLTLKCGAFFERSGSKLRSKARSAELRRGSNPLRRARHSGLCIVRGVRRSGSLTGYTRWRFFDRRKSDSAPPSTPDRGRRSRRRPAYSPAPARKPRWQPRWRCSRSPPPD